MFIKEYSDKIRSKHPETIALLLSDNKYIMLEEDAQAAKEVLGLSPVKLGSDQVDAAFFGLEQLDTNLPKLIRAGHRVAIIEVPFYATVSSSNDGMLYLHNAKTLKRYHELNNMHPNDSDYAVFYAFNKKQYAEGIEKLISSGYIKRGEEGKIRSFGGGGYGTKEGIDGFVGFYQRKIKRIAAECDPYEVYCYEYNNHESFISWDGDMGAIQIVIDYWGEDVARSIKRVSAQYSIDELIK